MKSKIGVIISILIIDIYSGDFNYSSYILADIDSIAKMHLIFKANDSSHQNVRKDTNSLVLRFDFNKYKFQVTIEDMPKFLIGLSGKEINPDSTEVSIFEMYLHTIEVLDPPRISFGIRVRSKSGRIYPVAIQNTLVEYVNKEMKRNEKIEIYCLHVYDSECGPGFLISEFQKMEQNK